MNHWYETNIWVVRMHNTNYAKWYVDDDQRFFKDENDAQEYALKMNTDWPLLNRQVNKKSAIGNLITNDVYILNEPVKFLG